MEGKTPYPAFVRVVRHGGRAMVGVALILGLALAAPARPRAEDLSPATRSLFTAVERNDLAGVQTSIAQGARISAHNPFGERAVDIAIDRGYYEIAHYLLSLRDEPQTAETPVKNPVPSTTGPAVPPPVPPPISAAPLPPASETQTAQHDAPLPPAWPVSQPNPFDPQAMPQGTRHPVVEGGSIPPAAIEAPPPQAPSPSPAADLTTTPAPTPGATTPPPAANPPAAAAPTPRKAAPKPAEASVPAIGKAKAPDSAESQSRQKAAPARRALPVAPLPVPPPPMLPSQTTPSATPESGTSSSSSLAPPAASVSPTSENQTSLPTSVALAPNEREAGAPPPAVAASDGGEPAMPPPAVKAPDGIEAAAPPPQVAVADEASKPKNEGGFLARTSLRIKEAARSFDQTFENFLGGWFFEWIGRKTGLAEKAESPKKETQIAATEPLSLPLPPTTEPDPLKVFAAPSDGTVVAEGAPVAEVSIPQPAASDVTKPSAGPGQDITTPTPDGTLPQTVAALQAPHESVPDKGPETAILPAEQPAVDLPAKADDNLPPSPETTPSLPSSQAAVGPAEPEGPVASSEPKSPSSVPVQATAATAEPPAMTDVNPAPRTHPASFVPSSKAKVASSVPEGPVAPPARKKPSARTAAVAEASANPPAGVGGTGGESPPSPAVAAAAPTNDPFAPDAIPPGAAHPIIGEMVSPPPAPLPTTTPDMVKPDVTPADINESPRQLAAPSARPAVSAKAAAAAKKGVPTKPPASADARKGPLGQLAAIPETGKTSSGSAKAAPTPFGLEGPASERGATPTKSKESATATDVAAVTTAKVPPTVRRLPSETVLTLGETAYLTAAMPPQAADPAERNFCVKKNHGAVVFCVVPVDWPSQLAKDLHVSSIMYQGAQAIVRYDNQMATRFHAIFPAEAYGKLVAYYTKRFGKPTSTSERTIAPFAQPRQDDPTTLWKRVDPLSGQPTTLEIRKFDDTRGGFPDMRYGAVMLYNADSPPIFPTLSALDLMPTAAPE